MNVFTSRRLTFSNLIGSVCDYRSDNHPDITVAKSNIPFRTVDWRHDFILIKPAFFQFLILWSDQSSQKRFLHRSSISIFPESAVNVRDKDRPFLSHERQKFISVCWFWTYDRHRSFPQNKKGLLEFSDYSGRPTFPDLLGPVCVYRANRFTGNV